MVTSDPIFDGNTRRGRILTEFPPRLVQLNFILLTARYNPLPFLSLSLSRAIFFIFFHVSPPPFWTEGVR